MIDTIKDTIDKFPLGYIFTTNDFSISVKNPKGVNKVLNDLVAEGYLSKLSKGRFYKPERGKFGDLKPDTTPDKACLRLFQLLKELDESQIAKIKKLVLKYKPQTIAMLGAMLETLNPQEDTSALFKKLNPITHYKLSISDLPLYVRCQNFLRLSNVPNLRQ